MRNVAWMAPLIALAALTGCTTEGAVYLSFDWNYGRCTLTLRTGVWAPKE